MAAAAIPLGAAGSAAAELGRFRSAETRYKALAIQANIDDSELGDLRDRIIRESIALSVDPTETLAGVEKIVEKPATWTWPETTWRTLRPRCRRPGPGAGTSAP